ncbi:PREDICTED: uncharacterized protein LOC105965591 isoform X2 [Erythranthe guttata]|uniref:uncharacterized protein LOC105965591 isoform X2 n=1 Tax=Erythranthe guttata TaxID=4155 RepID=UPI00064DB416|nr:PREDICTED: uncharacterized protein LOC105965591 isoform X2 [Erythranthe guttata]|eukprot:XP_012845612.1 PREDICTED: uncharacterized protein LOC105965591 isoform X2 [Erythranthe guttata]
MPKSESEEKASSSSSEEGTDNEAAKGNGGGRRNQDEKLPDYEMQRLNRIEENNKRMEALGLRKMANSFMGTIQKSQTVKKGKKKVCDEEDEEYNPTQEDEDEDSSSSEKNEVKRNTSTSKKRGPTQKPTPDSDFVDDDDALMQAIALSLQDSAGFLDVKSSTLPRKNPCISDDSGKRKKKKLITSRVQMTEDEMLIHFFQFDETGKGGITLRDIQRLATAHDFTWSEKELADMIFCFDNDGDGKISFDDFRKIVGRCNMLKVCDDGGNGKSRLGN